MNVGLQTGSGEGYLASISEDGEVATQSRPSAHGVVRSSVTVQTTSTTLAAARAGRRGLWVQNQGANPVYLRLEAAAATNADWLVPAGGEFRAEGLAYEGEMRAIAVGGTSVVLVLEMA